MPAQTFRTVRSCGAPSQVLPSPADADVILERRDEENLVLTRAERFDAVATGLRIAARSLAILARRHRDLAEEALAEELPWLTWLPAEERPSCVRELLGDLLAGAETGLLVALCPRPRGQSPSSCQRSFLRRCPRRTPSARRAPR
jgi:hypothetical protein